MSILDFFKYISVLGFPSLFAMLLYIFHKQTLTQHGIQALLRDRLYQLHDYGIEKGYTTREKKQNFENMYNWYHALGQNGVMTDAYNEFEGLPDQWLYMQQHDAEGNTDAQGVKYEH